MAKLDRKVAIVIGAARGLRRTYAKRLAGLGAKVAVALLVLGRVIGPGQIVPIIPAMPVAGIAPLVGVSQAG
jgi:NAD(P)-dependent dehydrogenase (short-subunit alcohol dehydrogenase family)